MDSRINTIEAKICNKSLLLQGLPAVDSQRTTGWNLKYSCELAKVPFESISSMSNHIIDTGSSILRPEFLTENQRTQFFTYVKQNRLDWGFHQKKYKVKAEPGSTTSGRLAKQLSGTYYQRRTKAPEASSRATSTPSRFGPPKILLPVHYWPRFPTSSTSDFQDDMFASSLPSAKKSKTFNLTVTPTWTRPTNSFQALSRAASDRTTTYRFSYDKAFGISNTKVPSSTFLYSILFMDMSQTLANLLSAQPQLPLVRTPSRKEEALLPQKVPSPTRENNPRVNPRAPTQIDPLIKLSLVEDMMTNLIQDP